MLINKLKKFRILLASKSARRQQLLTGAGIEYILINDREVDEKIPDKLNKFEIPVYLSEKKSSAYSDLLKDDNTILITADTIVWMNGSVIGKPRNAAEATSILNALSGNFHEVITGVTIRSINKIKSFHSCSEVYFSTLKEEEIKYYIKHFKPYDKAGSYGIQEWIGYIGIERIKGSFYNVMGLPVHLLYRELEDFITS